MTPACAEKFVGWWTVQRTRVNKVGKRPTNPRREEKGGRKLDHFYFVFTGGGARKKENIVFKGTRGCGGRSWG